MQRCYLAAKHCIELASTDTILPMLPLDQLKPGDSIDMDLLMKTGTKFIDTQSRSLRIYPVLLASMLHLRTAFGVSRRMHRVRKGGTVVLTCLDTNIQANVTRDRFRYSKISCGKELRAHIFKEPKHRKVMGGNWLPLEALRPGESFHIPGIWPGFANIPKMIKSMGTFDLIGDTRARYEFEETTTGGRLRMIGVDSEQA